MTEQLALDDPFDTAMDRAMASAYGPRMERIERDGEITEFYRKPSQPHAPIDYAAVLAKVEADRAEWWKNSKYGRYEAQQKGK